MIFGELEAISVCLLPFRREGSSFNLRSLLPVLCRCLGYARDFGWHYKSRFGNWIPSLLFVNKTGLCTALPRSLLDIQLKQSTHMKIPISNISSPWTEIGARHFLTLENSVALFISHLLITPKALGEGKTKAPVACGKQRRFRCQAGITEF